MITDFRLYPRCHKIIARKDRKHWETALNWYHKAFKLNLDIRVDEMKDQIPVLSESRMHNGA